MDGLEKKLQINVLLGFSVSNAFGSWSIAGALGTAQSLCGYGVSRNSLI